MHENTVDLTNYFVTTKYYSALWFGRLVKEIRPFGFYLFGRSDSAVWVRPNSTGRSQLPHISFSHEQIGNRQSLGPAHQTSMAFRSPCILEHQKTIIKTKIACHCHQQKQMIDNLIPDVVLEKRQTVQLQRTKLAGDLRRLTSRLFDPSSMSKSFAVSFSLNFTFEVDETESGMEMERIIFFFVFFVFFVFFNVMASGGPYSSIYINNSQSL